MTATLIDGIAVSRIVRERFKERAAALTAAGRRPGLAVLIVGDDPASRVYVRNKAKACTDTGLHSEIHEFPADVTAAAVLERIEALNRDPAIHGILVQLPLPKQIDPDLVLHAIAPGKDVDGFHPCNMGALVAGSAVFPPCTPYGCMALLEHHHIPVPGANAVVIGRSNIVGKPMALMLINQGATVTVCTSRTRDLAAITRGADILVVAVGRPGLITGDMVKSGAAVIDVGINRLADGRLAGDVDFASVSAVAGHLTPVPGGVGPMTISMLLGNTVAAAERASGGT